MLEPNIKALSSACHFVTFTRLRIKKISKYFVKQQESILASSTPKSDIYDNEAGSNAVNDTENKESQDKSEDCNIYIPFISGKYF